MCICVWFQAQEELRFARSAAAASDDISRLRLEREQADAELQLVTSERDVLMERLKVSTRCRSNLQISAALP